METYRFIPALTGIRAIAAFMVFFYHVPVTWLAIWGIDVQRGLEIGVSIFFVLSGFVITYSYQDRYTISFAWYLNYLKNRAARIFPVYFLAALPILFFARADFYTCLLNITLLNGLFQSQYLNGLTHTWSLTTEMVFYSIAPILFLLLDKFKNFLLLLIMYLFFLTLFIGLLNYFKPFMMEPHYAIVKTFAGRFFEFYIGIWLGYKVKEKTFPIKGNLTYIGVAGVFASIIILTLRYYMIGNDFWRFGIYVFTNTIFLPACTVLLLHGLISRKTFVSQILSSKIFQILGHSSYSFYVFHIGVLHTFLLNYVYPPAVFFILIAISIFTYRYFEKPLIDFFKKIDFYPTRISENQKL